VTRTAEVPLRIPVDERRGAVSGRLRRPRHARALLVLGHGAGAGMEHPFLEAVAAGLAARELATLRYQFPYMEQGRRRPDPRATLVATVRAAVAAAREEAAELPLLAGGKSMGGRMTSLAAAAEPLDGVRGLVFLGFPLHAAGRPDAARAAHLPEVPLPMLFVQGTRDRLADLALLRPVLEGLGPRAALHVVEDGDHSFAVPRRSGRTPQEVRDELCDALAGFAARIATTAA